MNFIAWTIVACEIGFWVVIALGLITRYIFKREKLGFFLLALTPVIDLILLVVTATDLYNGATATQVHAVAAIYLGSSIAFGKSMIRWADERFRYYVQKTGAKPARRIGYEHATAMNREFTTITATSTGTIFLLPFSSFFATFLNSTQ